MRIITLNVNGIRSAAQKGFFEWAFQENVDIICLQETKSQEHQLNQAVLQPPGYHAFFFDAHKKGYSGVALYTRYKAKHIITGLGWSCPDTEGRYIQADFDHISVASIYLPSGSSGPERQSLKFEFMDKLLDKLRAMRKQKQREFILCGDWNIAHKAIDLKNWRGNQKNSGFLPEERAWMDKLLGAEGFIDAFRELNQQAEQYTWWSNRGQAWAKNVGWRIDYQIITPGLKTALSKVEIYTKQRFSDHAPLMVDYNLPSL